MATDDFANEAVPNFVSLLREREGLLSSLTCLSKWNLVFPVLLGVVRKLTILRHNRFS